jgi:glycogen debranching enzyme
MYTRDTLISFKSLFLIPRLFSEGKTILKIIGATFRHGLIPNLFDRGSKPRYNARDTPWLYIKSIKDYLEYTNDMNFLKEEIELVYLSDKNMNEHFKLKAKGDKLLIKIENLIQNIFQDHANSINFREWYAGKERDNLMLNEGFNLKIFLDTNTGFIYGGNSYNNGTWMDRLNPSGSLKGAPFNPRNGADIEIISLLYICLDFVINALFFTDDTMHKIYEDKGEFNFLYQLPQILYSTLISRFIDSFIKNFALSQDNIIDLKHEKEKID